MRRSLAEREWARTPGRFDMEYVRNLKALIASPDPATRRLVEPVQRRLLESRLLTPGQVFSLPTLSNVSVQYKNEDYIGNMLMPRVSVSKTQAYYYKYGKADRLTPHDDEIGPRGTANEVTETRSKSALLLTDHALTNYLDNETMKQQDAPLNEMVDLVAAVNDGLALNKEIRIATVCTTAANFGSNTSTLSGNSQWDSSVGGDPVKNLQDATSAIWIGNGPGDLIAYTGVDAFNALSRHPAILDMIKYGGTAPGLASADMIASIFGWSKLIVGKARRNIANEGLTASYSRIWGKDFGIVRVARTPGVRNVSFGYDFDLTGDPVTDLWFDPKYGKSGGYTSKVAFSEDLEVVAADAGYLFKAVVS